jgi:hypothetical protein
MNTSRRSSYDRTLKITPLKAEEPPEAGPLAQAAYDLMPRIKITDLLLKGGRGEALGDINARHGNEPGAAFYTSISDQFQTGLQIAGHYTGELLHQLAWVRSPEQDKRATGNAAGSKAKAWGRAACPRLTAASPL